MAGRKRKYDIGKTYAEKYGKRDKTYSKPNTAAGQYNIYVRNGHYKTMDKGRMLSILRNIECELTQPKRERVRAVIEELEAVCVSA